MGSTYAREYVRGRVGQSMVHYTIDEGEKGRDGEISRRNEVSKRRVEQQQVLLERLE